MGTGSALHRKAALLWVALVVLAGNSSLAAVQSREPAAPRVALVIGNGSYKSLPHLKNPVGDSKAIAQRLRDLHFAVTEGNDLSRDQMVGLISSFAASANKAEAAVIYYAGHGVQVSGRNYLIPVDAALRREADLPFSAIRLDDLMATVDNPNRVNLIFLDACRDNPLPADFVASNPQMASRSTAPAQGLAEVRAAPGALIAYATDPERTAADGTGAHSPFTQALLDRMGTPGLDVGQMLRRVRVDVLAATNNTQMPWDHSSLTRDFYFIPPSDPSADAKGETDAPSPQPRPKVASLAPAERGLSPSYDASPKTKSVKPLDPRERKEAAFGPTRRRKVQRDLATLGYGTSSADGIFGRDTRAAIIAYEKAHELPETGYLTEELYDSIVDDAAKRRRALENRASARQKAAAARAGNPTIQPRQARGDIVDCRVPGDDMRWMQSRYIFDYQCQQFGGQW